MDTGLPPETLETALRKELRAGERLLWSGRMIGRVGLAQMAIWLFAIPWTAFALFWTGMAWLMTRGIADDPFGLFFPLFGIPFVLIGFGMLASPFLRAISAKYTIFGVTDQRIVRLFLRKSLRTESIEAHQVGAMNRTERGDGSGSIKITVRSDASGRPTSFTLGPVTEIRAAERAIDQAKR